MSTYGVIMQDATKFKLLQSRNLSFSFVHCSFFFKLICAVAKTYTSVVFLFLLAQNDHFKKVTGVTSELPL